MITRLLSISIAVAIVVGTLVTWSVIRRVDNFRTVCDRLVEQHQHDSGEMSGMDEEPEVEVSPREILRQQDEHARQLRHQWTDMITASDQRVAKWLTNQNKTRRSAVKVETAAFSGKSGSQHWAYRPLRNVAPPVVENPGWCRNPIDQFILSKLEQHGIEANGEASPQQLLRRLSFDMTGLPPTRFEASAVLNENQDNDYDVWVDRFLDTSAFGERWASVWLDLARYADSNGYEEDELRPNAYPYRDFVIWALNRDLPYDVFVRWQIAGDELPERNALSVAATGFLTATPYNTFMPQESERQDELDDMVSTVGKSMLATTIGCARCHDHMYDPISTDEYYEMVAIFAETSRKQAFLDIDGGLRYEQLYEPVRIRREERRALLRESTKEDNISSLDHFSDAEKDVLRQPIDPNNAEQRRLLSACERCLLITDEQLTDDLLPLPQDEARFEQLTDEIASLEAGLPTHPPLGLAITGSQVSSVPVLEGGTLSRAQHSVGPGFLSALTHANAEYAQKRWRAFDVTAESGQEKPRSALAYWLTDEERGAGALLARVVVNRIWQNYFGEGLVRTPSDFGAEGDAPTHPELLEWLARELVDSGWSLKHIHRLIVTSRTYRQDSSLCPAKRELDPDNLWVSRMPIRRLTAEMIRDSVLQVSGNLNNGLYGPGVKPPIPQEAIFQTQQEKHETWPCDLTADRPTTWRRTVYVVRKRTVPMPSLQLFDAPSTNSSCGERRPTITPTQALALMNSPLIHERARTLATSLTDGQQGDLVEAEQLAVIIRELFLTAYCREPSLDELARGLEFLMTADETVGETVQQRLEDLCHVVFMSNEFLHID